ncbi:MAG: protease complex subunit PrcB family protein [bacterium]
MAQRQVNHVSKRLLLISLVGCLLGCQAGTPISAVELFNHGHCQGVTKGIAQIQYEELAGIRNVQMLTSPADDTEPLGATDTRLQDVLLFVISNGNQPTPGYGFELKQTDTTQNEVLLRYRWRTPAADAILAQVMTSPCTVVQLDRHPDLAAVSAWLDGKLLGRVDLTQSAN